MTTAKTTIENLTLEGDAQNNVEIRPILAEQDPNVVLPGVVISLPQSGQTVDPATYGQNDKAYPVQVAIGHQFGQVANDSTRLSQLLTNREMVEEQFTAQRIELDNGESAHDVRFQSLDLVIYDRMKVYTGFLLTFIVRKQKP